MCRKINSSDFSGSRKVFSTLPTGAILARGLADDVTDVIDAVQTKSQHALEAEPSDKSVNEICVFANGQGFWILVLDEGRRFRCEGRSGEYVLRFHG